MKLGIIFIMLFLPIAGWGQSTRSDTIKQNSGSTKIEMILNGSQIINKETFDLKFRLRNLPDNTWFLKLNKDSTFEYIHWSGWRYPSEDILEKGKYFIANNILMLKSEKHKSELTNMIFYIVTSDIDKGNDITNMDCVMSDSKKYCLYKKLVMKSNRSN